MRNKGLHILIKPNPLSVSCSPWSIITFTVICQGYILCFLLCIGIKIISCCICKPSVKCFAMVHKQWRIKVAVLEVTGSDTLLAFLPEEIG